MGVVLSTDVVTGRRCVVPNSQGPNASDEERQQCTEEARWDIWTAVETENGLFRAEVSVCDRHAAWFEAAGQVRLRKPIAQI